MTQVSCKWSIGLIFGASSRFQSLVDNLKLQFAFDGGSSSAANSRDRGKGSPNARKARSIRRRDVAGDRCGRKSARQDFPKTCRRSLQGTSQEAPPARRSQGGAKREHRRPQQIPPRQVLTFALALCDSVAETDELKSHHAAEPAGIVLAV